MKVALVFPRSNEEYNEFKHMLEPPLGIAYIAAVLKQNKVEVKIFDGIFHSLDDLIDQIAKYKPDITGVYVNCILIDVVFSFANKLKDVLPKTLLIAGGPQTTVTPELILKNKNIDVAGIGEGEYTVLDLVKNIKNLEKVDGIYYKKNGRIIKNKSREFIKDIDSLPFPAYELLDSRYFRNLEKVIVGSRGCIFNCAFCQPTLRKLFGHNIRKRSPKNIVDEIEFLVKKYNTKKILFHDDTFTVDKKWVIDICRMLIERKLKIRWICNSRVNTIDLEMLEWMKKAGCTLVEFGVESGSDYIRNSILKKGTSKKQIKKAFLLCHKVRIKSSAYMMVGSPYETKETLNKSIELLKEIKPEMIIACITTPMPGTYLYDFCKERNLIKAKKWSDFDYFDKVSIKYEDIDKMYIEKIQNKIKFMSLFNYFIFTIKTLDKELIEEIFREPKRVPIVLKKCVKSIFQ